MKILVTGCAGFIGSHVSEKLLQLGYEVIGIDNINNYYDPRQKIKNLEILNKYENSGELQINISKSEIKINPINNINEYSSISKKYELIENKDQLIKFLESCHSSNMVRFSSLPSCRPVHSHHL